MGSTQIYQSALQRRASNFGSQTPHAAPYQSSQYAATQPSPHVSYQTGRLHAPSGVAMYNPNAPRAIEVFHLSDAANAAIPADIREQFHTDDRGHVLFFSSPPIDVIPPSQQALGHSIKYLATRDAQRERVEERKRKKAHEQAEREERAKRARADEESALASRVEALANKAVEVTTAQIIAGTSKLYESLYGEQADRARVSDSKARERMIATNRAARAQTARMQAESERANFADLRGNAMYMDDIEPSV